MSVENTGILLYVVPWSLILAFIVWAVVTERKARAKIPHANTVPGRKQAESKTPGAEHDREESPEAAGGSARSRGEQLSDNPYPSDVSGDGKIWVRAWRERDEEERLHEERVRRLGRMDRRDGARLHENAFSPRYSGDGAIWEEGWYEEDELIGREKAKAEAADRARREQAERRPPPPPPPKPEERGWWTMLQVMREMPLHVIDKVYRERFKRAHPDMGGSHEEAVRLNTAMEEARKEKGNGVDHPPTN